MKYLAFCLIVIALTIAAPFVLLGVPATATTAGLVAVAAQQTGLCPCRPDVRRAGADLPA